MGCLVLRELSQMGFGLQRIQAHSNLAEFVRLTFLTNSLSYWLASPDPEQANIPHRAHRIMMIGTYAQPNDIEANWHETLRVGFELGLHNFFNIEWLIDSAARAPKARSWN